MLTLQIIHNRVSCHKASLLCFAVNVDHQITFTVGHFPRDVAPAQYDRFLASAHFGVGQEQHIITQYFARCCCFWVFGLCVKRAKFRVDSLLLSVCETTTAFAGCACVEQVRPHVVAHPFVIHCIVEYSVQRRVMVVDAALAKPLAVLC